MLADYGAMKVSTDIKDVGDHGGMEVLADIKYVGGLWSNGGVGRE